MLLAEVSVRDLLRLAKRTFGDFSYLFNGVKTLRLWQCGTSGVKFFDPMICGDDRFYEMLNKADWYYLSDKDEYSLAAKYVSASDHVLDVGSGSGEFAKHLPSGAVFRGLELSRSGVARARTAGRDVLSEPLESVPPGIEPFTT